ncbi:MAG: hypothetical protein ACREJU_17855 [Nitrospiraceae bacterium]
MNMSARVFTGVGLMGLMTLGAPAAAIDVQPTPVQIATALERGNAAAASRTPPDRLYAWFGSSQELEPRGFLMTKIAGLRVLATHFALRGQTPTDSDIRRILDDEVLLISVTLFGDRPTFAVDSYMLLFQSGHTLKPAKVRFDGQATRTAVWPQRPAYQAKVVAAFRYADLIPDAKTRLSVFPPDGGEISFDLDFATIE